MLGCHRLFQKMCMYEAALRVPMLVKPPARGTGCSQPVFAPGVRGQLTQHLDLAATICDYAGLAVMPGSAGRSFRAVVEDPAAAGPDEVFAEFNGNSGRGFQQRAIVTPTHKYIHNHGYAPELYDLRADPAETVNLCQADASPPQANALRARLRRWMGETGDYIHMGD
jgi:arylsulfatase A-like enzyme